MLLMHYAQVRDVFEQQVPCAWQVCESDHKLAGATTRRGRSSPTTKGRRTPCPQRAQYAEVHSVTTAPPWLLGPRFLTPRFPGECRDPGTTEPWAATRRTSNHHGFRSTGGAVLSRGPEYRAGGKLAALRFAPWQRLHRGS